MTQKAIKIKRNPIQQKNWIKMNLWCWGFVSLTLIFYLLFQGYPILCSLYYSLFNWSGMTSSMTYVGLENYQNLLKDNVFWGAFRNSFRYMIMVVPLEVVISLFFAYLLNDEKLKARTAYRVSLFVPVVVTASIVGIVMIFIWSSNGIINYALKSLHLIDKNINWLGDARYALWCIILILFTTSVGQPIVLYVSALGNVDQSLVEAAEVDGATPMQVFWKIKWPQIMPTTLYIVVITTINSFQCFALIQLLTSGGPNHSTDTVMYYIYYTAFKLYRYGYGNAMGVVLMLIIALLSAVQFKLGQSQD